jgi:hypothetical protein
MGPPEGGPDVFPPLGYDDCAVGIVHGGDGHAESLKKYPNVQEFPQGHLVGPQGTHHTKLWLIFYGSFIRVCVLTANNVKHHLENQADAVWVQDFPLKKRGSPKVSEFETDLVRVSVTFYKILDPEPDSEFETDLVRMRMNVTFLRPQTLNRTDILSAILRARVRLSQKPSSSEP